MAYILIKNNSDKKIRADVLLAGKYPSYSRAALAKLFNMDKIIDDKTAIKAGSKVKPGESIKADISLLQKPVQKIDLPVIYEDENVIVIDKPCGVISHARGKYWDEPSVASFIRDKVANIDGERAGIVHRLDRATSGVMICAKNQQALQFLQQQFSKRNVEKTYIAIVKGLLKQKEALIDVPIGRNPSNPKLFKASQTGKNAITYYRLIKQFNQKAVVFIKPYTGRTHQIRVHFKYLDNPIIGDDLYGSIEANRLMLHAYSLKIKLPDVGNKIFYSTVPPEFIKELGHEATS
jgi:23S rRNA pseudouridine1911/1915/1917 synthase